jgi:hypothetical protein
VSLSPFALSGGQGKVIQMEVANEKCPWCGNVVSHDKFVEIETRIRTEEQKRLSEAEAAMRQRLEAQAESVKQKLKDEAAKQVALIAAERDVLLKKAAKESEAREAAIRKQAAEEAAKQLAAIAGERDAILQKAKEFEDREAAIRKEAEEEAARQAQARVDLVEQQKQKDLNDLRTILEADRDQTVLNKQAEFAREREGWQKKIMEMDHQLQRMNANQIGEGAEVNLFETLREAFPGDTITRVKKGQPGADFHHDVMHKGEFCGRFVYDSKNRQAWQYTYVTKLREDQLEAKADHAILCTTVFPSAKKELCVESDVVVVNPARAVHVIHLLRRAMIEMHVRGLSMKQRAEKTNKLYRFIISASYSQRFSQVVRLTEEMLELDVQEKKTHDTVWKRRGTLLTRQGNVLREIDTEISAVIEGTDQNAQSAA